MQFWASLLCARARARLSEVLTASGSALAALFCAASTVLSFVNCVTGAL